MGTIIITGNKWNGGGGLPPQQKIDVAAEGIKFAYSTFEEVPEVFDLSDVHAGGLRRFNRAGDYPGRTSKLSCSQRTGFAGGNRTRK